MAAWRSRRPCARTCARSSGASEITLWCERRLQGGRNSGRVVAMMSSGACAPRSASARIRSSEVGSAQCRSSKASDDRLRSRACQNQGRHRRQLPAPQFLRREFRRAVLGQRNVDQRREQGRVFGRVEADQPQSVLEIGESLLGGRVGAAKPQPAPFGDRVQRRVLQELRRRPFDPGVRRLAEPCAKLLDQPRLADAGLADDQRELALACERARPAAA